MATQVKEKVAIDHFKNNYDLHLDYLGSLKHDLKGQTIKPLKDIKVNEELTLGRVFKSPRNENSLARRNR